MLSLTVARNTFKHASGISRLATSYSGIRLYTSTMHDNDAQLLEREKRRNLSGGQHRTSTPIDNAPGWNEHLASTSEAHVKADRSTASIHDMQRNTVDYIHARHSPDERLGPREASYVRDEVNGPLGSARVGEFEGVVGDGDLGLEDLDIESDGRTVTRRVVHEETTVTRESEPTESEANKVRADKRAF